MIMLAVSFVCLSNVARSSSLNCSFCLDDRDAGTIVVSLRCPMPQVGMPGQLNREDPIWLPTVHRSHNSKVPMLTFIRWISTNSGIRGYPNAVDRLMAEIWVE
jgi:hypothetical protein